MTKWIVVSFSLLVLIFVGTLLYFGRYAKGDEREFRVKRVSMHRSARGIGKVECITDVTSLGFTLGGRIKSVQVDDGQTVKQGQVMAELETTALDLEVARAQAGLKEAQAQQTRTAQPALKEELLQAEERLNRAALDVKSADLRLKTLTQPVPPPPATPALIQAAALDEERTRYHLNEAVYNQNRILNEMPSDDDKAVALAQVNLAQVDFDDAQKTYDTAKNSGFKSTYGVLPPQEVWRLEENIERMKKKLELTRAEYDRIKRGPSPSERDAAKARAQAAKVTYDLAVNARKQLENPVAPPAGTEAEVEQARIALGLAQAAEREARAARDLVKARPRPEEVAAAQAAVERAEKTLALAQVQREQAVLRAPYDGAVVERLFEPGATPAPFAPVFTIAELSHLRVRAELDVSWSATLQPGQPVDMFSRSLIGDAIPGKVSRVLGQVGPKTLFTRDPSESRGGEVAVVLIDIDPPVTQVAKAAYGVLRPGLRLDVEIKFESREDVLCVPRSFVTTDKGHHAIYKSSAPAQPVEVELGFSDGLNVEIKSGLMEGDVVIRPQRERP